MRDQIQYEQEDRRLIEQYRRSRSDADFEKIVNKLERPLRKLAHHYCRFSRKDVADAVQDSFLWLFENINTIDTADSVFEQLFRRVKLSLSRANHSGRRHQVLFSCIDAGLPDNDSIEKTIADQRTSPRRIPKKKIKVIRESLKTLSPRQRQAIDGIYYEDLTQQETARKHATSRSAVSHYKALAIKKLRNNPELRNLVGLPPIPPKRPRHLEYLTERQLDAIRLICHEHLSFRDAERRLAAPPFTMRNTYFAALAKIALSPELQALTGIKPPVQ